MSKFHKVCRASFPTWAGSSAAFGMGCPVVGTALFALALLVTAAVAAAE